jgi:hypothetical protein
VSFGTVIDFSADLAASIHPEDGGAKFLRNFGKYTPKDTASYLKRLEYSAPHFSVESVYMRVAECVKIIVLCQPA